MVDGHPGSLAPEKSFMSLEPACLELSGIELAENGRLIVRICNQSGETIEGKLKFGFNIKSAELVNFTGRWLEKLDITESLTNISLKAHQVVMLSMEVKLLV